MRAVIGLELSTVLLGVRTAWREEKVAPLRATAAEFVHGETLRLPGQFLQRQITDDSGNITDYVKELRRRFDDLRPIAGTRHGGQHPFVFRDLATTDYVFIRHDGPKEMLRPLYDDSFAVTSRGDKNFTMRVQKYYGINRPIKPAYVISDLITDDRSQLPGSMEHGKSDVNAGLRQSENTSRTRTTGYRDEVRKENVIPRLFPGWIDINLNFK
ncbi:uncharacterized protein LOC105425970 [Pogonomyrmex barbatus]|uniref:Uncharacterized protein LOC105425970 n=1 Tax=Pogonomyrmex barbatus TaxID=144034 RepID=A0A6I9W997_9HYME|nr:uncharacterized protein LOC105425970 [Pogonomyrmex barbatus]